MFGFHRRRVARFECETLFPKLGAFPHKSQTDDTVLLLIFADLNLTKAKDYLLGALNG
jgi:hypothetical protein